MLLAAGGSRRLGQAKQRIHIDGLPLLRRMALAALASAPRELLVALGAAADECHALIADLPLRVIEVPDWTRGMGASLAALVQSAPADCGLLALGVDQPALDAAHLRALVARWRCDPRRPVASGYAGIVGTPALFPPGWRARLAGLDGDVGARMLLRASDCAILDAPALAFDIDRPEDLS
ncbi:MAG: hypothetical protein AMXMBFR25_27220 [Lysobacterales bacterium]